jgi:hypothetical protein
MVVLIRVVVLGTLVVLHEQMTQAGRGSVQVHAQHRSGGWGIEQQFVGLQTHLHTHVMCW